jgi:TPR repeat protein
LLASEAGHVESMHSLGVMHLNGEVVVYIIYTYIHTYIRASQRAGFENNKVYVKFKINL